MELPHARAFVAVVASGSFSAAAASLHLTQGAVSKHVAALESQIGLVLLRRSNRGVALTEAGHLLLPVARDLIASHARADEAAHRIAASARRSIGRELPTGGRRVGRSRRSVHDDLSYEV